METKKRKYGLDSDFITKGELIGIAVITALYAFISQVFFLVPINLRSESFWITVFFYLLIVVFYTGMYCSEVYSGKGIFKISLLVTILWVVAFLFLEFISLPLFHAKAYSELITIEDGDMQADLPDMSKDPIAFVDDLSAQNIGDRQIAAVDKSTFYNVDDQYNLIKYNGKYIRVSLLNYGGFDKAWMSDSIPAYIEVEATNKGRKQAAAAVTLNEPIVYSESDYCRQDLMRHIHFKYPTAILGSAFFEINDNGTPCQIIPTQKPTIGFFGGKVEKEIIINNAATGDTEMYANEDVPEWVDHAHSVENTMKLLDYHFVYKNGFLNTIWGKVDVFRTSYHYRDINGREEADEEVIENQFTPFAGYSYMIAKDGDIYMYTGITPDNTAESNKGFVLVNTRTQKAKYYEFPGAEESSAQNAAEGLVSDLRYSASFPSIATVDGEATFFMVLKDSAGLVHRYSICNMKNYSEVVEADTIDKAITLYRGKVFVSKDPQDKTTEIVYEEESATEGIETFKATGRVLKVTTAEVGGYTNYYFMFEGDEHVYVSSIANSSKQPMLLVNGINIDVEYYDSGEEGIRIVTSIDF